MKNTLAITAVIFTIGFVTLPIVWGDSDFHWGEIEEYKRIIIVIGMSLMLGIKYSSKVDMLLREP